MKKYFLNTLSLFAVGLIYAGGSLAGPTAELVKSIDSAATQNAPTPLLSQKRPDITLSDAYRLQHAYVELHLLDDHLGGFKAALTSKALQQQFHTNGPLSGVLMASGKKKDGDTIHWSGYRKMMIETEVAFIVDEPINRPIKNIAALRKYITTVAPAVEIPDVAFADLNAVTAVDIAADNTSAKEYIIGEAKPIGDMKLQDIKVTLKHEDKVVNEGSAADLAIDAWSSALWLVNQAVARGYTIQKDNVLLTGNMGNMTRGDTGKYDADFGSLGKISFEVK